jgi:uncharacterized protein YkwD
MGRATIVSNKGGGLYTAKPIYDFVALDKEISDIQKAATDYAQLLVSAIDTLNLLRTDSSIARNAMNSVINQWKDELISKQAPIPPIIPPPVPNDPDTGQPWVDPDRAQEAPLLAAINAKRTGAGASALTRNSDLNKAALKHIRTQSGTNRMGHIDAFGLKPADRVYIVGYAAETTDELLSYGTTSPQNTVDEWDKSIDDRTAMINPAATECGVAYIFTDYHPTNYLWCVLICKPGTPILSSTVDDPAKDAAKKVGDELQKIKAPETDAATPDKLGEVAGKYAETKAKEIAAEKALEKLMLDKIERDRRLAELQALKTILDKTMDVWACYFNDQLIAGDVVYTAEVPGFWKNVIRSTSARVYVGTDQETTVFFEERSWNIVLRYTGYDSRLKPTTSIREDAVFYNCALEPATLKWKPAFKYGIITAMTGTTCNVRLNDETARKFPNTQPLSIDPDGSNNLVAVPFDYPPCNSSAFRVDDEVLIKFTNFDYTKPVIIGFRRAPRSCATGRFSWEQI